MKKAIRFILLMTMSLFSFLGCSHKIETFCGTIENSSPVIDLNRNDKVSLNDFVESTEIIQLETSPNSFISRIGLMRYHSDKLYILDWQQDAAFCFDVEGKFLYKIGSKGQGPGEYLKLEDIAIDTYNDHILLLEPFGHLLVFDLDGHFILKRRLPKEFPAYNEVYVLDSDTLLFVSCTRNQLLYYSFATDKITKVIDLGNNDIKPRLVFASIGRQIYNYDNSLFYLNPLCDQVIDLKNLSAFHWNFGKRQNTPAQVNKLLNQWKREEFENYDQPKSLEEYYPDIVAKGQLQYEIFKCHETNRYAICFVYLGNHRLSYIFLDKTDGKYFIFNKTTEGLSLRANPMMFIGESLFLSLPASYSNYTWLEQKDWLNEKYFDLDLLTEKQKEIIKSHSEEDNPLIIKYNLRK